MLAASAPVAAANRKIRRAGGAFSASGIGSGEIALAAGPVYLARPNGEARGGAAGD
jgi:hypothetical protein